MTCFSSINCIVVRIQQPLAAFAVLRLGCYRHSCANIKDFPRRLNETPVTAKATAFRANRPIKLRLIISPNNNCAAFAFRNGISFDGYILANSRIGRVLLRPFALVIAAHKYRAAAFVA